MERLAQREARGAEQTDSAYLTLKQQGDAVTGAAGGSAGEQHPIEKAKLKGDRLTFEITVPNGSFKVAFNVQPDGNTMTGSVQRERNGEIMKGQLELKREK